MIKAMFDLVSTPVAVRQISTPVTDAIDSPVRYVTLSLPSQLPLRHQPSVPVVPQGFDFPLLLLLHLEQADPLGDPVRGDSVPLSKLDTCKVVHEHLCLQFPGENDRVTVRAPGLLRLHNYVGTGYCQGVRFAGKGSTERKTGVSGVPGSSSLRGGNPYLKTRFQRSRTQVSVSVTHSEQP